MHTRIVFFICFLFLPDLVSAQMPFAQAGQAPLVLNPSQAGNKNKNRISAVVGQQLQRGEKSENYQFSYDNFLKKSGMGVGIYAMQSRFSSSVSPVHFLKEYRFPEQGPLVFEKAQELRAGVVMAPKYNVMDKVQRQKIRYSISPALYLMYVNEQNHKTDNFSYRFTQPCSCTDATPDLVADTVAYTKIKLKTNHLMMGAGVMLTSDQILAFFRVQHETSFYSETVEFLQYNPTSEQLTASRLQIKQTGYAWQAIGGVGISLPKRQESLFHITPFVAAGFKRYLNLRKAEDEERHVYSTIGPSQEAGELTFSNFSVNLRYRYVIGGVAFTQTLRSDYYGVSAGFQNSWSKTLVTINFQPHYSFVEVGTGVWF